MRLNCDVVSIAAGLVPNSASLIVIYNFVFPLLASKILILLVSMLLVNICVTEKYVVGDYRRRVNLCQKDGSDAKLSFHLKHPEKPS